MHIASHVAVMRQLAAMEKKLQGTHGSDAVKGAYENHILGAQAEMVVAKALNLFWPPAVGVLNEIDVGGIVQVRARTEHWHDLMVHHEDRDDEPVVLVRVHNAPEFELVGWIYHRDAKRKEFWKDYAGGRPTHFVSGGKLRDLDELREILQGLWKARL